MTANIRGYAVRANSKGPITFLASSDALARDGMIIERGAWDLKNYKLNPIVLANHDYRSLPIGKATRVEETHRGLEADIEFDMGDPVAVSIRRKIVEGFLNCVSVGWDTKRQVSNRVKLAELLDISVVSVPGDPNALAIARSAYSHKASASRPIDIRKYQDVDKQVSEELLNMLNMHIRNVDMAEGKARGRRAKRVAQALELPGMRNLKRDWPRLTSAEKDVAILILDRATRKAS